MSVAMLIRKFFYRHFPCHLQLRLTHSAAPLKTSSDSLEVNRYFNSTLYQSLPCSYVLPKKYKFHYKTNGFQTIKEHFLSFTLLQNQPV